VCVKQWVNNIFGLCCFANVTKPLKDPIIDGAVLVQTHGFHRIFKSSQIKGSKSLILSGTSLQQSFFFFWSEREVNRQMPTNVLCQECQTHQLAS
jgi:hypothetical protein